MSSYYNSAKCIVCGEKKHYGRDFQLFKFPYDVDRCRSWVKAIGIRDLIYKPIEELRQHYVCQSHFDPACINNKLKLLHKVAIPLWTPYPCLSDDLLSDFPISQHKGPVMLNFKYADHTSKREEKAPRILNADPVINYERPLMNSLETLIHNERHTVKKPAGILNSIAVPLMTYSSSLEKGTVFAAEDPGSKFQLPFVPFIEANAHNQNGDNNVYEVTGNSKISSYKASADSIYYTSPTDNQYKATKTYINVKALAQSTHVNPCDFSVLSSTRTTQQGNTNTADSMFKKPLVGTVKPNLKTVERGIKTKNLSRRNYNVSFGLKTLITGSARKAARESNVNAVAGTPAVVDSTDGTAGTASSRYRDLKQYTNNKLMIHSIQKNIPLVPITRAAGPGATDATLQVPDGTTSDMTNIAPAVEYKATNYANTNKITLIPSRVVRDSNGTMVQLFKSPEPVNTNLNVSLVPSTAAPISETLEATGVGVDPVNTAMYGDPVTMTSNVLELAPEHTDTDLLFVPYSQYVASVTPESTNAHTAEGTLDYGLPLMNCIGTVFQGNIRSTIKTEDVCDEVDIDVPLMQYFKTLENSTIE